MMKHYRQHGFTLAEMVMVIVITGIIAAMVAVFIKKPVEQYLDVARRAELTDIADLALRRMARDLRLALPNSVRVTGACGGTAGTCFIEFLPTGSSACGTAAVCLGGGRYRAGSGGNELNFDDADTTFNVLGAMPTVATGDQIVVYNLGIQDADAYAGNNRRAVASVSGSTVTITATSPLPFNSPGHRFHVITTPVTYVCAPAANGVGGTLTRYWGYPIASTQPSTVPLTGASSALLATKVSTCRFAYDANVVAQRSGLVTMQLGLTDGGETVSLYSAAHVSNVP